MFSLFQDEGSKRALASIEEDLAKIDAEGALESDVGAGLGNTAKRLSLGKGKKATYRAEKAAKKKKKRAIDDSDDDEDEEVRNSNEYQIFRMFG